MFKLINVGDLGEQTIKLLYSLKDQINFAPYYQRQSNVWNLRQRQLLIDTIINDYDIPKLYFHYFTESNSEFNVESNQLYGVVDGKQRMEAIFDFIEDRFSLDNDFLYVVDETQNLKGLKFSQLLETHFDVANKIYDFILDVVFVQTDEMDRLEELFIRLNGGVALTNAEKRNAIGGYLNARIRELVQNHEFFLHSVNFKNSRYQHNDLLSKLLFLEDARRFVALSNPALETFLNTNRVKSDEINSTIERTVENLNRMGQVFRANDKLLRGKGVIPVYYVFVERHAKELAPIRPFLEEFELLRFHTRKHKIPNDILQTYDLFNQQGVNKDTSLEFRFLVLENYFLHYLENGDLTNFSPNIQKLVDDQQSFTFDEL